MTRYLLLFLPLCLLLASSPVSAEPTTYAVRLASYRLSFSSPKAANEEFQEVHSLRDLSEIPRSERHYQVWRYRWDFREGFLNYRIAGTLVLRAHVSRADEELSSERALTDVLNQGFSEMLRVRKLNPNVPGTFQPVTINGVPWMRYWTALFQTPGWAVALPGKHYVTVEFDYIDNSLRYRSHWKDDAKELVEQIGSSLRLEPLAQ